MDYVLASSVAILQIIWIDLLLSGDNAVVIALACRSLPPHLRKWGIILGAGVAILLRIIFALIISELLLVPFLKVVGGLLLVWIAVKLAKGEEAEEKNIAASDKLYKAVWTIAIADAVMSLDNVVAIAAVSKGDPWLFGFGLALSIPLIMVGSQLIMKMIEKFPIIVWAGAALLGWIAGEMIATDPVVGTRLGIEPHSTGVYIAAAIGAALVVAIGYWLKTRSRAAEA
ncbi:TerC family protein [Aestuariivirga sp. YIM B02566]|uniref:TerC family protein n=1 Tax=Taklimakanibacter albus TaxID=2800327 RepID=A0ACC5R454_9HYPH|nr:TerC family protein [Aestuariivirga sp. YIM B02566]MBK1867378.1 TerC family protein [Aestuariivirga sp. YIM B02566]